VPKFQIFDSDQIITVYTYGKSEAKMIQIMDPVFRINCEHGV